MAHYQQIQFVNICKSHFSEFFQNSRVLEVGSWDANGSVRKLFFGCNYIGLDIAAGTGVDLVCQGQDLDMPTAYFDVVISCECFEHNRFWIETFVNMIRVLKPGGLFIMTCGAKGRIEHGTRRRFANLSLTAQQGLPDYYRNLSANDFESRVSMNNHFICWDFLEGRYYSDLYFIGIKKATMATTDLPSRLQHVIREARNISVDPGLGASERSKRILLSSTSKILERVIGGRRYHDLTFFVDRCIRMVCAGQHFNADLSS